MDGFMRGAKGRVFVLLWLAYLAKFVIEGYCWDLVRLAGLADIYCSTPGADPEGSIGVQRFRWLIWRATQERGIEWRRIDKTWKGIWSLYLWRRETNRMARELMRFVAALRPIFAGLQIPGNTLTEQMENLDQVLKLAEAGRIALADPERQHYRIPRSKDNPEVHNVC